MDSNKVAYIKDGDFEFEVHYIECVEYNHDPDFVERFYELDYVEGVDALPELIKQHLDIEQFEQTLFEKAMGEL